MNKYRYNIKILVIISLLSSAYLFIFIEEICIYLYARYGFRPMVSLCLYYLILFIGSISYVFLYNEKRKWIHILLLSVLPSSVFLALRYPIVMILYAFLTFLYIYSDLVPFYNKGRLTKKRIASYLTKYMIWFFTWSAVVSLGVMLITTKDKKQERYDSYEIQNEYQKNIDYLDEVNMIDV